MERLPIEPFSDHPQHLPILIGSGAARGEPNEFVDQRFKLTDLDHLAQFVAAHRADAAECLPLFAAIGSKPAGDFESLAALHAVLQDSGNRPSGNCIRVMRDLMLLNVDRRLRAIYRQFFSNAGPKPGLSHEQKIAALQETRHDVQAVLDAYDWHWLADWLDLGGIGETAGSCLRRLGNFAFAITRVVFLFTHHCNISCRHCYNNSGPHKKATRIPLDRMLAIVAQMPEAGITRLNLTGGEPFLYPQDVLAIVKAGRAAGLDGISINTNGFWASTDARASQTLERLAQAGFMQGGGDRIKVSAGVYHAEFIAFDRILVLARNYFARFGQRVIIDFEVEPRRESLSADEIRSRIDMAGLAEQVVLRFRHLDAVGRAADLGNIAHSPTHLPCRNMTEIMINPDETAMPCAGFNHQNKGILIGSSHSHCLKDLIKRTQNDPILQSMATKPWDNILSLAAKEKKRGGYTGKCALCQHAIGDLTDREPLQAALFTQQNFYPFWFTLVERI
jgi:Radical SAM superfamily/4Fe-4S single cluster domain